MASIDKRPDGRYRARWREWPGGPQKSKHFARKTDAQNWLDEIRGQQLRGVVVNPHSGKVKFSDWWEEWRPTRRDLSPSTVARDDSYWRNHIAEDLGPVPVGSITRTMVRKWMDGLVEAELAPKTVRHCVGLVHQALAAAIAEHMIVVNPAANLAGLPKVDVAEMRIATPDEIATLHQAMDERFRAWLLTAAYSGLRFGELAALRRRRVDLDAGTLRVTEGVTQVSGRTVWGPPKTKAGRRTVPMPSYVVDALEAACEGLGDDDLVFAAPAGGALHRTTFRRRFWIPAATAAGLGTLTRDADDNGEPTGPARYRGLRMHDLRHTSVSAWIAVGANIKQLTTWAGHTSAATLIDRYGHMFVDDADPVMDKLDQRARTATPNLPAEADEAA